MPDKGLEQGQDIKGTKRNALYHKTRYRKRRPARYTDEIATIQKDIDIFAGYLTRFENPDPVINTEAQGKGLRLYDQVKKDWQAGAVLQTRILAVVGKEWEIIPAESEKDGSNAKNEEIAQFVKEVLLNCNFDQARQELLMGILYGYYVWEVMWKVSNDNLIIDKLFAKHPKRFIFSPERELRLLTLESMIDGEQVPNFKFVVFTFGSSDNPYGEGLGQRLWWPVWFKKNAVKFWLILLEKFGSPTVIGKYPPGTHPDKKTKLMEAINALQQETGVTIPNTMALELLEAVKHGQNGRGSYEGFCDYMDNAISKIVLGQTLTTEVKNKGAYAASKTHDHVREDIIKSDADVLCECINNSLIPWIVDLNFPGVTEYPKIWIRVEKEKDLKELAERDKILVTEIGLPVAKSYFYETYGIERPLDVKDLLNSQASERSHGPKPDNLDNPDNSYSSNNSEFKEGGSDAKALPPSLNKGLLTEDQKKIDDLIEGIVSKNWRPVMNPLTDPIFDAAKKAKNYSDFLQTLTTNYELMDQTQMMETLRNLMFLAENWGRFSVQSEHR